MYLKRNNWFEESTKFYNSDPPAPTAQESTASTLSALQQNLPGLMQAYNAQVLPTSEAQLAASQATSPAYTQLLTNLYQQFAPQLAATGSQVDAQTRNATANTDASILSNQGSQISSTTDAIDRANNPEYYATRAATSNQLGNLLGSFNLGSPNVEAERNINQENFRTGNAGTPSATNTVNNALQFGSEQNKRQAALSSAIGTATNFLGASNNPVATNAATSTLSKPVSQSGTSQFNGITPASTQAYSSGQGLLSSIAGFQNQASQINANNRDTLDRVNQTMGAVGSL